MPQIVIEMLMHRSGLASSPRMDAKMSPGIMKITDVAAQHFTMWQSLQRARGRSSSHSLDEHHVKDARDRELQRADDSEEGI